MQDDRSHNDDNLRNQLCKLTAELAVHIGGMKDPMTAAKNVFDRLIDYMPLPPATEDGSLAEVPNLEFTKVESSNLPIQP